MFSATEEINGQAWQYGNGRAQHICEMLVERHSSVCGTGSREGDRYSQNGVRADARLCGGSVERDHCPVQFKLLREDPASKRVMKHSANIRCRATAAQPLVSPGISVPELKSLSCSGRSS